MSEKHLGQVMVLTVLSLGGTLLGVTAIAGLLMLFQIRQATDLGNSAKAIFAADTGIEWALFDFDCHKDEAAPCDPTDPAYFVPSCWAEPPGTLGIDSDGKEIRFFDVDLDGVLGPLEASYRVTDDRGFRFCVDENSVSVKSVGSAGAAGRASSRAFELAL
jgi:hypothetical protein